MGRLRSQQATEADRALMQKLRPQGGGGGGGFGGGQGGFGGGGGGGGGRQRQSAVDFQFGGTYIVFVNRGAGPEPVYVRTGLTDLDYSEVVSGLSESDAVMLLPSASLLQSQQEFKDRLARMSSNSGVPGIGSTASTASPGGSTARPGGTAPPGGGRP